MRTLPVAHAAAYRASSLSSSDLSLSACVTMVTGVIPILKIKESFFQFTGGDDNLPSSRIWKSLRRKKKALLNFSSELPLAPIWGCFVELVMP